jgi:putative SOS response-associated peptidase YedK
MPPKASFKLDGSLRSPRASETPRRFSSCCFPGSVVLLTSARTGFPALASCRQISNRKRRCILPVDGFFEWKAIEGQKAKQPYAIAMKNASPFGIGGLWENWRDPTSGKWMRTFAIITTDANELVAQFHDRMPLLLAPTDYTRWLSDEPDPGDLMRPFPAEPMRMWPISTRVNKPENDDPSIVEPIAIATSAA